MATKWRAPSALSSTRADASPTCDAPVAEHLRVKMKAVRYSAIQKVQTVVASILLGWPYTSSINHRLVPDQVAAREWGMDRFS